MNTCTYRDTHISGIYIWTGNWLGCGWEYQLCYAERFAVRMLTIRKPSIPHSEAMLVTLVRGQQHATNASRVMRVHYVTVSVEHLDLSKLYITYTLQVSSEI